MKRRTKIAMIWLAAAGGSWLLTTFVIRPSIVFGDSMEPTLQSWDFCLMARTYHYEPRQGEIVMFRTSDDPPLYFIKRVVAVPGQTVAIDRGVIRINGSPLNTPQLSSGWELESTVMPQGKILVAADNPDFGYGVVATRLVKARLIWVWRWKK